MGGELALPYYPASVRHSREVDALPECGCILIVVTWDQAQYWREGIKIRRGEALAGRTVILSMGARDILAQITGATLPIVITIDVRGCCPAHLLARIDAAASAVNATIPQPRLSGAAVHPMRGAWVVGLPWS